MKNLLLIGFIGLVLLTATLALVLWNLPFITNLEAARNQVATVASAMLQRRVTLERLSLRAIPSPGLQVEDLTIAERNGVPLVAVGQLIVEVKVLPLLERKVTVDSVTLKEPAITLIRNADGSLDLPFPSIAPVAPALRTFPGLESLPPITLALEEASVKNGEVTIRDRTRPRAPPFLRLQGLDIKLDDVSLAPRPQKARKPTTSLASFMARLNGDGSLALREGTYRTAAHIFTVQDLRGDLSVKKGVVRVDDLSVKLLGGTATGSLIANLKREPPRHTTDLKFEGLQMAQMRHLYTALGLPPGLISGTASMQQTISTLGTTPDELVRGLTGTARIEIKNGTIRKMETLGKILMVLNLKRLFTGRLPDMSREGVPFDRISGTLRFKNGRMTTNNLSLKGPAVDVAFKGTVSLQDGQVAMVATALGMDFDVRGPADDPTVSYRSMKGFFGLFR